MIVDSGILYVPELEKGKKALQANQAITDTVTRNRAACKSLLRFCENGSHEPFVKYALDDSFAPIRVAFQVSENLPSNLLGSFLIQSDKEPQCFTISSEGVMEEVPADSPIAEALIAAWQETREITSKRKGLSTKDYVGVQIVLPTQFQERNGYLKKIFADTLVDAVKQQINVPNSAVRIPTASAFEASARVYRPVGSIGF